MSHNNQDNPTLPAYTSSTPSSPLQDWRCFSPFQGPARTAPEPNNNEVSLPPSTTEVYSHPPPTTIPLGFASQLRALKIRQDEQDQRIANLEAQLTTQAALNTNLEATLSARVDALEQHILYQTARRKEVVSQLINLRTLNQEASNAYQLRITDIEPDDLEGTLSAWATSTATVMNHHQQVLRNISTVVPGAAAYNPHGYNGGAASHAVGAGLSTNKSNPN